MKGAHMSFYRSGLQHFHFWCLQSNRPDRGFSSRKATLRRASLCRVEVKMLQATRFGLTLPFQLLVSLSNLGGRENQKI